LLLRGSISAAGASWNLNGTPMKAIFVIFLNAILIAELGATGQAQDPRTCRVRDERLRAVKYTVGHYERSTVDGQSGVLINISIKPTEVERSLLLLLARHLNKRYCREPRIVVGIFDNPDAARRFDGSSRSDLDALRGEYVLDRQRGIEYVSFTPVPDYYGHPTERIRIELGTNSAP
jgi:hypothetical protein